MDEYLQDKINTLLSFMSPFIIWYAYRFLYSLYLIATYQRTGFYDKEKQPKSDLPINPTDFESFYSFSRYWWIHLVGMDFLPSTEEYDEELVKDELREKYKGDALKQLIMGNGMKLWHPQLTGGIKIAKFVALLGLLSICIYTYFKSNVFSIIFGFVILKIILTLFVDAFEWIPYVYHKIVNMIKGETDDYNPEIMTWDNSPMWRTLRTLFVNTGGMDVIIGFVAFSALMHAAFKQSEGKLTNYFKSKLANVPKFKKIPSTVIFCVVLVCLISIYYLAGYVFNSFLTYLFVIMYHFSSGDGRGVEDFRHWIHMIVQGCRTEHSKENELVDKYIGIVEDDDTWFKISMRIFIKVFRVSFKPLWKRFIPITAMFFAIAFCICILHAIFNFKSNKNTENDDVLKRYASLGKSMVIMSAFMYLLFWYIRASDQIKTK